MLAAKKTSLVSIFAAFLLLGSTAQAGGIFEEEEFRYRISEGWGNSAVEARANCRCDLESKLETSEVLNYHVGEMRCDDSGPCNVECAGSNYVFDLP